MIRGSARCHHASVSSASLLTTIGTSDGCMAMRPSLLFYWLLRDHSWDICKPEIGSISLVVYCNHSELDRSTCAVKHHQSGSARMTSNPTQCQADQVVSKSFPFVLHFISWQHYPMLLMKINRLCTRLAGINCTVYVWELRCKARSACETFIEHLANISEKNIPAKRVCV